MHQQFKIVILFQLNTTIQIACANPAHPADQRVINY